MRQGIYRPGRAVQRVTANFGNRAFIRGGVPTWFKRPAFIGPDIPEQPAVVGTPFSFNAAPYFSGAGVYGWTGGGWASIDPVTGVLSGDPEAGTLTGNITLSRFGTVASSNVFNIITPESA